MAASGEGGGQIARAVINIYGYKASACEVIFLPLVCLIGKKTHTVTAFLSFFIVLFFSYFNVQFSLFKSLFWDPYFKHGS